MCPQKKMWNHVEAVPGSTGDSAVAIHAEMTLPSCPSPAPTRNRIAFWPNMVSITRKMRERIRSASIRACPLTSSRFGGATIRRTIDTAAAATTRSPTMSCSKISGG